MKKKTSISLDEDLFNKAKELDLNISQITDAALFKVIHGYDSIELEILTLQNQQIQLKSRLKELEQEKETKAEMIIDIYNGKRDRLDREQAREEGEMLLSFGHAVHPVRTHLEQIEERLTFLYQQKKDEHREEEGMRLMRLLNERIRQFEYKANDVWISCQDVLDELKENGIEFNTKKELQAHIKKLKEAQLYS